MKNILIITTLLLLTGSSCEKKEEPEPSPKGDITLSSKILGSTIFYTFGFSFEEEKFISSMEASPVTDIKLVKKPIPSGFAGVQFSTETNLDESYGFYRNESFNNSADALQYYNTYNKAVFPQFSALTEDTIKSNEVWTFRTFKKNYVKILVKDIRNYYLGSPTANYTEVDIKYFIQRDGPDNLTE